MFALSAIDVAGPALVAPPGPRYKGPERRHAATRMTPWLAATLDEIDYGMVLLTRIDRVLHANQAACAELDAEHPLQVVDEALRARHAGDTLPFVEALHGAARRGLRKMLTLGEGADRVSVSIVPLRLGGNAPVATTLVMLGKRRAGASLAMQAFARSHGLTAAETRVLFALGDGASPGEIAAQLGVGLATVRTQIGCIRQKTGAGSIRALIRQVATLPPLMSVLHAEPRLPQAVDRRFDERRLAA